MLEEGLVFIGSYGGRGSRLRRPEGSSYTNGGPKSLLVVGGLPLGAYPILQAYQAGIRNFFVSVNREEDRVRWLEILGDLIPRAYFQVGLHGTQKPTDVFTSNDAERFLEERRSSPILWGLGDDYLPPWHICALIRAYKELGISVASRKSAERFDGCLNVSPVYDESYIIYDWKDEPPKWVPNPPMIISPRDRREFLYLSNNSTSESVR